MKNLENNYLIAEFMGRKFYAYKDSMSYNKEFDTVADCQEWIDQAELKEYQPQLGFKMISGEYDSSWDWLMNAVERIEDLYLHVQISSTNCFIHWMGAEPEDKILLSKLQSFQGIDVDGLTKIEATYKAVIEFIKWYNFQK